MNYVGIDHHRQYSHMTVMDQMGQVLRSGRVPNLQNDIGKFLEGFEAVEAVIETGRSSYTMVDVLEEMGVTVKIAHPNEVKAIARAKIKTDKRDSEVLAHLLRMNMIPEVYRRSPENRRAQRILRQRAFYVREMTALKNRVYALLAQQREEVRQEVAPAEDLLYEGKADELFPEKQREDLVGEDFLDDFVMEARYMVKSAIRGCASFGNQYMDMGMEVDAITESLDHRHHSRHDLKACGCVQEFHKCTHRRETEIIEELSLETEEKTQHLGNIEDDLPVRDIQEKLLPHPIHDRSFIISSHPV
jgi:hypothetical protein